MREKDSGGETFTVHLCAILFTCKWVMFIFLLCKCIECIDCSTVKFQVLCTIAYNPIIKSLGGGSRSHLRNDLQSMIEYFNKIGLLCMLMILCFHVQCSFVQYKWCHHDSTNTSTVLEIHFFGICWFKR